MYAEYLGEQQELGERILSKIRQISDAAEKLGAMITALTEPTDQDRPKVR